jgi:hypothetical protein
MPGDLKTAFEPELASQRQGAAAPPAMVAAPTNHSALRRTQRFCSSQIAWAAAIIAACATIGFFNSHLLAWLATGFLFLSIAAWHDALRGRRVLCARLATAEARATELEGLISITAPGLGDDGALRRATALVNHTLSSASTTLGEGPVASDIAPSESMANSSHGLTYLSQGDEAEREAGARQRRTRRMPQEMLYSNLGRILDLSRGGLRVRIDSKRMPSGIVVLDILADGGPLRVQAEVVWTKVDKRIRDAGLRFVNLSPDAADRITAICMQHRCRTTMTERSTA